MELVELTERLVGFNTVSQISSTRQIADFISNYCEDAGFAVEQYPYTTEGIEKVNVLARKGGQESKLAFSGHMDTVPANSEQWVVDDPFALTKIGDNYYGRGIADMKLFLAIAMKTGEAVSESRFKQPFALCFSSDEEVGCLGMKELLRQKVHVADWIVVGEPTELVPIRLHKGYMYVSITLESIKLKGKSGHGSDPRQGYNVIELALPPVINALNDFRHELESIKDFRFNPPYPTMNIGVLRTDEEAVKNTIAGQCKMELEIRPIPDQDIGEIFDVLRRIVINTVDKIQGIQLPHVRLERAPTLPMETSPDAPIVQLVVKVSKKESASVCYNTEAGLFNLHGSQAVIWGPGSKDKAHDKKGEFVNAEYFQQEVIDKYIQLITEVCC